MIGPRSDRLAGGRRGTEVKINPSAERTARANPMLQWINDHQALIWALGGASVVVFVLGLLLVPVLVVRVPTDYFAHDQRPPSRWAKRHPVVRLVMLVGKNLLGGVLIVAGLAMLALPGQGLLTLLLGFLLIDLPGKYRIEKWLVRRRWVHRPIDWMRRRRGREPLSLSPPGSAAS